MYNLILCVKTDRVIYFTETDEPLYTNDTTYKISLRSIPEGMTLSNCWDWHYRDSKSLQHNQQAKQADVPLIELNRQEAILQLERLVEEVRKKSAEETRYHVNKLMSEEQIKQIESIQPGFEITRNESILLHEELLFRTEYNFYLYSNLIKNAKQSSELLSVRDIFSNTDITKIG